MKEFKPQDMPPISPGNPVWLTIQAWAEMNLERLREQRETDVADLRKLDIALGSIISMKALLDLPEQIKQERERDPINDDSGFGIPNPDDSNLLD